jgi:hypothetical protein
MWRVFQIPQGRAMCRNIRTLFNFEPPTTEAEIHDAALQFVRKICGFTNPAKAKSRSALRFTPVGS